MQIKNDLGTVTMSMRTNDSIRRDPETELQDDLEAVIDAIGCFVVGHVQLSETHKIAVTLDDGTIINIEKTSTEDDDEDKYHLTRE